MSPAALRFVPRLLSMQLLVAAFSDLVAVAFAPRLLLLDQRVLVATLPTAGWVFAVSAVFSAIITLTLTRRLAPTLRALAQGTGPVPAQDLLSIYALPARIATSQVFVSLAASTATLLPNYRPITNDLYNQVALILLYATIVMAGALPLYVRLRSIVARVLQVAPENAAYDAVFVMAANPRTAMRARTRLLVAVAGPVAFVALGASLLVYAHTRAFESTVRARTASDIARGVFDHVRGTDRGREQAILAAEQLGYYTELSPNAVSPSALGMGAEEETTVLVPLTDGYAAVHFEAARLDTITFIYALLAFTGVGLAALLAWRVGTRFCEDLRLVTNTVRTTGVADIIRGTRMVRMARFISVGAMMDSIEQLGDIFREFAAAHEQATHAREATERMRGLFLASMSHDLKAPLNAILGFAALASRAPLTDGQRESLAIIEQRGRELLHLIQTILDAARVEAGAFLVTPEWTVVDDVVMSAVLDARDLMADSSVQVVGEVQRGVPKLQLDSLRIVQALTGIITSAVRFTHEEGTVLVRATFRGDRLHIDVETPGRALPEEEREKIFEAFKYADKARRHGALGLGLSLARSIIEVHGGTIDVATMEGGGMVFQIALPTPYDPIASSRPSTVSTRGLQ
ncbi:HAMP domain-containing histidine kinase [Pendulispora brunnea]|uniref:histidine kinase n=1 Tax=Pendulispora brunnea TaxID=2905690 RepID=A0ABZ2K6I5_9BACT